MKLRKTEYGIFVGGSWVNDGEMAEIRSPFDQTVVARVVRATKAHLNQAIAAAAQAFETTRKMAAFERRRVLDGVAAGVAADKEEFARAICLEAGKPIRTARAEVERAIFTLQVAAEESTRIGGEVLPLDLQEFTQGRWAMVRRFPIGPVAAITPFNFPLNLVCHKLGPALAAGCPVVLKPASQTPVSALLLAEVIERAGWPKGALSVVNLSSEDAAGLVEDERLKLLSFTGSAAVGWPMKARCGKKKVALELGGNAACIVHEDADLEKAAARCAAGGFSYAGQSCISVQRILVHENVYDGFVAALLAKVDGLKLGDPADETTDVGPLIRQSDVERVQQWVNEAVAAGASILTGGRARGPMFEPTVLTGTRGSQKVNCMEVFAPVVTVEKYADFEEALWRVNDSEFGLQAGVFTRDVGRIFRAYEVLEVGGVIVGDVPTFRIDHMPYGGMKNSGLGREGLKYAIEEMTERKLMVVAV